MSWSIRYHPKIKAVDLPKLPPSTRSRLKAAIEQRLLTDPLSYGTPLKRTLKGYWKFRMGDYRIVYRLQGDEIHVLGIMHRKDVYKRVSRRNSKNQ